MDIGIKLNSPHSICEFELFTIVQVTFVYLVFSD